MNKVQPTLFDPLTHLCTRRLGMKRLQEELRRAWIAGTSIGVLLIDVDHFRSFNRVHGPSAAHRALVQLTQAAREILRGRDQFVRFSDAMFLAVLPGATLEDVMRVGER